MHPASNKNWFNRNSKWLLSCGCLTIILVSGGFIAAIWYGITEQMKSFAPYQQAVEIAKSSQKVTDLLGKPIEEGSFFSGTVNHINDSGDANISIPLSGPNGKARLLLKATKKGGKWTILELSLESERSKNPIQLISSENKTLKR